MAFSHRAVRTLSLAKTPFCSSAARLPSRRHAHHDAGVKESFDVSFWIAVGCVPAAALAYNLSRPATDGDSDDRPALTRVIEWYEDNLRASWIRNNDLRSQYLEQARQDANLLMNTARSDFIDLKNPEVFNTGSPFNVAPGQYANIDKVIAHYEKVNADAQAAIAARTQ